MPSAAGPGERKPGAGCPEVFLLFEGGVCFLISGCAFVVSSRVSVCLQSRLETPKTRLTRSSEKTSQAEAEKSYARVAKPPPQSLWLLVLSCLQRTTLMRTRVNQGLADLTCE